MKKRLNELTTLFKKNNFDDLNLATDAKKLLYLYGLYHYYYGDPDCILDVKEHCDYKIGNTIQACFEPEAYEEKIIDVISTYYVSDDELFLLSKVQYFFSQVQNLIAQLKNNYFSASGNESILKDYIDSKSKEIIVVKVLTNYCPSYDEKIELQESIENLVPLFDYIRFEVVFGDDIIDEITQLTSDKKCVEQGSLQLYDINNYLTYGEEKSIICNVSALSLKANYNKYGKAGLFAMNLRFYISNKKVDAGLEDSIKNKGHNFWYYNNGIIIVCDDYSINGDAISLSNYSIVNGGQTTRMIGVIPFDKDFAVSCKIIRNKYKNQREENAKFISEVAEASNTQKPINSTDIIANKPEQRLLKENLSNSNVFVQIKRGDAAMANLSENYPEAWQKTKNDELAQIIYGSIYQRPGTARNSKDKIFSDKNKYELVFENYSEKKYSNSMIKDLLYLRTHYKKWASLIAKDDNADEKKKGLVKNGFLFFSATILLMAKFYYSNDFRDALKVDVPSTEKGKFILSQKTFNHRIFNDDFDALQKRMYELFNIVYDKYIYPSFMIHKENKPDLAYSNFTKIDKNYLTTIVSRVFDDFYYDVSGRILGIMNNIFYKENEAEKIETKELVSLALEGFDLAPQYDEPIDLVSEKLTEKLKEYRTQEYKARGIKAYEVFTNQELSQIVKLKPRTTKELFEFRCFKHHPRTKTKYYGNEIVRIVVSVCGERMK